MSKKPSSRVLFIALALILIALIPLAIIRPPNDARSSDPTGKPVSIRTPFTSSDQPRYDRHLQTRVKKAPSHRPSDLKKFHLSPQTFQNVSLEEAFGALLDDYYAICEASGESPIRFKWSVEGKPTIIPYLYTQGNFHSTCRLLALLSGTRFEIKDDQITFTELSDDEISTRRFVVPPTFTLYLNATFTEHQGDPFVAVLTASDVLHQIGLLNTGEELTHSLGEGRIKVTGSGKTQWIINELTEITSQAIPLQTRLNFSGPDQETPSPSVIVRPGSQGSIPLTILQSGRSETYQQALTVTINPHGLGERINLYFNAEEDPFGGYLIYDGTLPDQSYIVGRGDSPEERTVEIQIPDSSGALQQRTLTLQHIDATGQPIPTTGNPSE